LPVVPEKKQEEKKNAVQPTNGQEMSNFDFKKMLFAKK
jgi:hypothetical protein